jgi:hypothetical protein
MFERLRKQLVKVSLAQDLHWCQIGWQTWSNEDLAKQSWFWLRESQVPGWSPAYIDKMMAVGSEILAEYNKRLARN